MMTTLKTSSTTAALKAERERDKAQALRDYDAERRAREANMMRLRALRLARENAHAQVATAPQPIKKKAAIREAGLPRANGPQVAS